MSGSGSSIYVPRHRKGGKKVVASTQLDRVEIAHLLLNFGLMAVILVTILALNHFYWKPC